MGKIKNKGVFLSVQDLFQFPTTEGKGHTMIQNHLENSRGSLCQINQNPLIQPESINCKTNTVSHTDRVVSKIEMVMLSVPELTGSKAVVPILFGQFNFFPLIIVTKLLNCPMYHYQARHFCKMCYWVF